MNLRSCVRHSAAGEIVPAFAVRVEAADPPLAEAATARQ
jgi:hypothetical protein